MNRYNIYIPAVVLITASLFFIYDIAADLLNGSDSYFHILVEFAVFTGTSIALYLEIRRVMQLHSTVVVEKDKVARLSGDLFNAINRSFEQWNLTATEKEIALLLIRGLSMQEIGVLRGVKEKTIRQQATQIYAKSGYSNRDSYAGFFR